MTIYNLVKQLLEDLPTLRDNDKLLIWKVWYQIGLVGEDGITLFNYMKAPSTESIRRCRQKIQEVHEELRGLNYTKRQKLAKEEGATFIYREPVQENLI